MQFHSACVNVISVTTNFHETGKCPAALGTRLDSYMEIMYRRYTYFQENNNPFLQTCLAFNFIQFEKKKLGIRQFLIYVLTSNMAFILPNFTEFKNDSTTRCRGRLTDLHKVVQETGKVEAEIHLHL